MRRYVEGVAVTPARPVCGGCLLFFALAIKRKYLIPRSKHRGLSSEEIHNLKLSEREL
jgi:hypothetical protein